MLEIESHKYLKKFVNSQKLNWEHVYSFGRIISKSLQSKDNYLINSEIFITEEWYCPLLISLFLNNQNTIFILSKEKIEYLKQNSLPLLEEFGFTFRLKDDCIFINNHKIFLYTLEKLISNYRCLKFKNKRIIFSDSSNIKRNLKDLFRINLEKKDWFYKFDTSKKANKIIRTYSLLKQQFFSRALPDKTDVFLDKNDIQFLKLFFNENSIFSERFSSVKDALISSWGCWVTLDYENFEWILHLEPIDEILEAIELFTENFYIFLSASRKDNFLSSYFRSHNLKIDLIVDFKSNFLEKEILIYVPSRQILPNNPNFSNLIFQKCNRLIYLRKGLTVVLTNQNDLKKDLATQLAAVHGQKVMLENSPNAATSIICSSFDWWINNLERIQYPQQIIIPLLPIPSLSEPINTITVSYIKGLSKDWFREFLLIEAFHLIDKSLFPLRRNSGKLIILDGRINNRQWGRDILKMIQPSKVINYKFPFE